MKAPVNQPKTSPEWTEYLRFFESLDPTSQGFTLQGFGVRTLEALIAKLTIPEAAFATTGFGRVLEQTYDDADEEEIIAPIVRVRTEEHERRVEALCKTLAGEPGGYGGLRDAFRDVTGDFGLPAQFVHAMLGKNPYDSRDSVAQRMRESINTSTWPAVLGDSITRRIVEEFQTGVGLNAWRSIVSQQVYNCDFRTRRTDRLGGYQLLPTVAQGATYNALPSPANDEATYTITKRGGTEDLTMESFVSDDVGTVRRIISSLARAAANTINRGILDFLTLNANVFDGSALFVAGHANTTATALSSVALDVSRIKMRKQSSLSDTSDVLGLVPRILVVPPELELTALNLLPSYNAATRSNRDDLGVPLDLIVANHFTTTTGWWLIADPAGCPTIEMGFAGGTADPGVQLQGPDWLGGADFTADRVSIKLRHIWGATVAEYRGFQRGNS